MAYASDKKPGELTTLPTLDADDVFVVGDTSDASEVAKVITKANLIIDLGASFEAKRGADDNYVTDAEKTIIAATTASYTTAEASKLAGIEALADVTDAGNVGSSIHGATAKTTPVDADTMPLIDSAASNVLKKVTWANIKATIKAYTDTLYAAALGADDNYVTDAEKAALHTHANKATLDNITAAYTTAEATKLGHISITQAVDLDALETASHAAVTVTDSTEIDFTLTGQAITASLKTGSIDETKLDTSVNASLDLADSAVQPAGLSGYFQTANIDDTPVNGETAAPISSNWAYDHAATAASDTTAGHVELATAAETTTGTDATRAVSPDGLAGSDYGKRHVTFVLNGTTALTTSEAAYWRVPSTMNGWNLVAVGASVGTGAAGSSSSGNPTFTVTNITQSSAAMLSTALTVDANEYTSASAATAAVIDTANDDVATDDLIKIAVTTAGTGTTYATVTLTFQLP